MDQIVNRLSPDFVWPTVGHPGRVPLNALVPDPEQPRKYFGEEELLALAETMKAENDGEQREILTVRALTAEENAGMYPLPARYMIISGERRWRAAPYAGLGDIEIRVKKYKSRAHQKLDAYMLNGSRVGLSDIENAHSIADLAKEFGWKTQEEIARHVGEIPMWVSQHLALLKLSPKVQALMSPEIKEYLRLARGVGVFLSHLSFQVQDDFAERMPKGERVTATQQIRWLQEEVKKAGIELPIRKFQPATLRRLLCSYATQVERRAGEILKFEELNNLFSNATLEQAQEVVGRVKDAQNELEDLVKRIEDLLAIKEGSTKKPAPAPAIEVKKLPKPKEDPAPLPKRPVPKPLPAKVPRASAPVFHASKAAPAAPKQMNRRERTFTFYDDTVGRLVTQPVTPQKYVQLWDAGKLGFQQKSQRKPEFMPTREGALGSEWNN